MKGNINRNTSKQTPQKVYVYDLSKNKNKRPTGGRDVSAAQSSYYSYKRERFPRIQIWGLTASVMSATEDLMLSSHGLYGHLYTFAHTCPEMKAKILKVFKDLFLFCIFECFACTYVRVASTMSKEARQYTESLGLQSVSLPLGVGN